LKGNDTNVCLYEVKQEDVEVKEKLIPPNLPTVPGTHKLHQIVAASRGHIYYRNVSCFCGLDETHEDHGFKKFVFPAHKMTSSSKNKRSKNMKEKEKKTTIVNDVPSSPENISVEHVEVTSDLNQELSRVDYFEDCLRRFLQCPTYDHLKETCNEINNTMNIWPIDQKEKAIFSRFSIRTLNMSVVLPMLSVLLHLLH